MGAKPEGGGWRSGLVKGLGRSLRVIRCRVSADGGFSVLVGVECSIVVGCGGGAVVRSGGSDGGGRGGCGGSKMGSFSVWTSRNVMRKA